MKITIIGSGYVGLVTGTCLADLGNDVICVDIVEEKINNLKKGIIPIFEPGLDELIKRNVKEKRLTFTTDLKDSIRKSEIIFIAVGTPPKANGEADLSYIENVARAIGNEIDSYKVIVEKSTVPVETGEKVKKVIQLNNPHKAEFDVVSNPEFLREGSAVSDFLNPDRIVIGTDSKRAAEMMARLYKPLNATMITTDIRSAEIIKHASNSFLATKISFINAIANICEKAGGDVEKVAEGMGYDKRIGRSFLNAGIGYGGSCFPKDVSAFIKIAEKNGYDFRLLRDVESINKQQKLDFIKKIEENMWILNDKKIAILGLSFKPNTDDMREAPSIDIINALQKEGAKIKAYDPEASEKSRALLKNVDYCSNPYDAVSGCDAMVIVTEWNEFKELDMEKVKSLLNRPLIIDGRNIYDPAQMKKLGFEYVSIGRK